MVAASTSIPNRPRLALKNQTDRDNVLREYVAGTSLMSGVFPRAMPQTADDVLREVDNQTYELMMFDPKVAGSILLLVASVVADGHQLTASIIGEDRKPDKDAQETKEFCDRALKGLPKTVKQISAEMLKGALQYGNKVAEKMLKEGGGEDKGKLVFASIKPKPRRSLAFVVDAFMNLYGFIGAKPNGVGFTSLSTVTDLTQVIPLGKFAVLTLNSQDCDPRGMSHLRPAYNAWNLKRNVWPEFLRWLINCALAGVFIITAQNAADEPKKNEDGEELKDASGNTLMMTSAEAAVLRGQEYRNGFVAAFPFGTQIVQGQSQGEGGAFKDSVQLLNAEITEGILFQNLATSEGEHQARAAAQSHMTVLDMLIFSLKSALEDMWYGVLKELVRVNQGDEAAERLTPHVSFGTSERRNFATDLAAYAKAYKDGFLLDDQLPDIYSELGLKQSEMLIQRIAKAMKEQEEGQNQSGQDDTDQQGDKGKQKIKRATA